MTTYPEIEVQLIGADGDAFAIIGKVQKAIRRNAGTVAATEFIEAATNCDSYDALLQFVMETVEVS